MAVLTVDLTVTPLLEAKTIINSRAVVDLVSIDIIVNLYSVISIQCSCDL